MAKKKNPQKYFFELLATTPIPEEYAKEKLGDKFEPLKERMLFIVTSTGVVIPSPLYPARTLSTAEQKINKDLREIRPLLLNYGNYSVPIDYIPVEERESTFAALCVLGVRQLIEFNLAMDIPTEQIEDRKKKTLAMFYEMFERHVPAEKLEALENMYNEHLVRENIPSA